jgi:hypothetical protein
MQTAEFRLQRGLIRLQTLSVAEYREGKQQPLDPAFLQNLYSEHSKG